MFTLAQGLVWQERLLPEDFLKARSGLGSCHRWVLTGTAHPSLQPQNKPISEQWRGPGRTVCKCLEESELLVTLISQWRNRGQGDPVTCASHSLVIGGSETRIQAHRARPGFRAQRKNLGATG